MNQTLEVHVPISPTRRFFLETQFLAHSLRANGGVAADAKIVVTVGDDTVVEDLAEKLPWSQKLGVEFRWLPVSLYQQHSYFATALERFKYPFSSDFVLQLDADTIVVDRLDGLYDLYRMSPGFYGLITHVSPLVEEHTWEEYWSAAGLGTPEKPYEHTGFGYMEPSVSKRYCPAYFNLGVLFDSAANMNRIGEVIYPMMEVSNRINPSYFRCQIALALAIAKQGIKAHAMPMRFNMANDVHLEALHPDEAKQPKIIHYLRENQSIGRDTMFNSRDAFLKFLDRKDLRVTNQKLQAVFASFFDVVDEEQRSVAPEFRW